MLLKPPPIIPARIQLPGSRSSAQPLEKDTPVGDAPPPARGRCATPCVRVMRRLPASTEVGEAVRNEPGNVLQKHRQSQC